MPTSKYDKFFGGSKGSAAKARAAMRKHYKGDGAGDRVFYALMNKRRSQGQKGGVAGALAKNRAKARAKKRGTKKK